MARDLRMAQTGDVTMGGQIRLTLTGGWRGKHPAGFPSGPVPVCHPSGRFIGVSPARPGAELHPGEVIQATEGGLTHPGAIVELISIYGILRLQRKEATTMGTL